MNIAVDPIRTQHACELAIIGAGPYGLATAAHARAAGAEVRVFGEPMSFWRGHMPNGMKLRSPWIATHIAHPQGRLTLDEHFREVGLDVPKLLPLEQFVDYGLWFQQRVAPDVDTRKVVRVEPRDDGFRLVLADGEAVLAQRVVVAAGLHGHEYRPAEFDGLPRPLVIHSSEHIDSECYRGKHVAVIGRGQSACESAALVHEAGAEVEIIARGSLVWNADPEQRSSLRRGIRSLLGNKLIPPSQVGPFPYSWLNELPGVIHLMPESKRDALNEISLRATAITWLRDRLKYVPVHGGQRIRGAAREGDGVALRLESGTRRFDHVILATGYRTEVDKMTMLAPPLRARIARHGGLPRLSGAFESTVPGLYFVGAAAVASFGPLVRFIAGAGFAARRVARAAARGRRMQSEPIAAFAMQGPVTLGAGRD